jgi:hypothetical protein
MRSIAHGIQSFDGSDTSLIDSLTPLSGYIFLKITWHGGHDLNLMLSEELGQLLHAWFQEHGKVRSDLDWMSFLAKNSCKFAEMGMELGRSAGQVDKLTTGTLSGFQDQLHDRPFHDFIS